MTFLPSWFSECIVLLIKFNGFLQYFENHNFFLFFLQGSLMLKCKHLTFFVFVFCWVYLCQNMTNKYINRSLAIEQTLFLLSIKIGLHFQKDILLLVNDIRKKTLILAVYILLCLVTSYCGVFLFYSCYTCCYLELQFGSFSAIEIVITAICPCRKTKQNYDI